MRCGSLLHSGVFALPLSSLAAGQSPKPPAAPPNGGDFSTATNPVVKVPTGAILVKGAWSSVSDSVTPVPEGNTVADSTFSNKYFGMTYALPAGWTKGYDGPPPSDTGRYVLAQIRPEEARRTSSPGRLLITAQDMFFTPLPAGDALQLVNYMKDNLQAGSKLEQPPSPAKIAGHPFTFFSYWSPVAELHWYVLATEIRCHAIQIVLTSHDTKLLASLVSDMEKMTLPEEANPTAGMGGGAFPVCVKDYARNENVLARVDPVLIERRFNAIPVRIIINKKGAVKHVHVLSAFPEQAKAIIDALFQWRFRPYLQNGTAVEVETGIMFGSAARPATTLQTNSVATQ